MQNSNSILQQLQANELQRRIDELEHENKQLKYAIYDIWSQELVSTYHHNKRIFQQDIIDRWQFYHAHKENVATKLCLQLGISRDQLSWSSIKKETDALWLASSHNNAPNFFSNHQPPGDGASDRARLC